MKHTSKYFRKTLWLAFLMLPVGLAAQNLKINGCYVILNGPVHLVLHNAGLNNNGSLYSASGKVWFTGDQPSVIGGTSPTGFREVVISKSTGAVTLQKDIQVPGSITMNSGKLLLNNHTLDLGSSGSIIGESNQSYITGFTGGRVLTTKKLVSAAIGLNPGNIGVALTSSVPLGNVTIERKHIQEPLFGGLLSINRSFVITSNVTGGLDVTLRFFYFDDELAGTDETGLNMWTDSDVGNFWTQIGYNNNDITLNWVSKEGLAHLGRFTLGGPDGSIFKSIQRATKMNAVFKSLVVVEPSVYPNPSTGKFNLVFYSNAKKEIVLNLYNLSGRLLQRKTVSCEAGRNSIVWDLGFAAAGTYVVSSNDGIINLKIIKQ